MRMHLRISDITVIVDSREKKPLDFSLCTNSADLKTEIGTLSTGDYSIKGLEQCDVVLERKSLPDLLQSITWERDRFERELRRMQAFKSKIVLVEASWGEICSGGWRNQIKPQVVQGTVARYMSWGIPFHFAPSQTDAAKFAANFLWLCAKERWEDMRQYRESLRIQDAG